MKKILSSLVLILSIMACSMGPRNVYLSNREINTFATKKINVSANAIVGNVRLRNNNTMVKNGYIYSDINYSCKILGGALANVEGIVKIKYELEVVDNKLFIKSPELLSIKTNNNLIPDSTVRQAVSSIVVNTLELKELHDFRENHVVVKDIVIGSNNILLVTE